jgi:IS605 OrfB family transposase
LEFKYFAFFYKTEVRQVALKVSVQVKVSGKANRRKLLLLEELYSKYQAALKLFYNYAKDNRVYELKRRTLIEKELQQKLYYTIKESLNLHSQLVQSARIDIVNDITSWLKVGGEFPKLSEKPPTLVDGRSYHLFEQGRGFKLWAKICGTAYPLELGDRQFKPIKEAERIGEAKLVKKDEEWYLYISVEVEEAEQVKPNGVLGVDLGLRNSAVLTASRPKFIEHRRLLYKVTYYWKEIDKLKSRLSKGQKSSKRIKRIWRKIARINNFIAHDTSAKIVKYAIKEQKAIALERLAISKKGYNKEWSRRLSNWLRGKTVKYVEYKAKLNSVTIVKVNPAYSSQRCHFCSGAGERFSSRFKCKVCGRGYDADYNASSNIARRATPLLAGHRNHARRRLGDEPTKLPASAVEQVTLEDTDLSMDSSR